MSGVGFIYFQNIVGSFFGKAIPPRLSVTVYQNGLFDGGTQRSELVAAADVLGRIAHDVVTSGQLSGVVTDRNGVVAGIWTYTPTAAA